MQCPESVLIGENFVFKVSIPVGTEFRGIVLPSFDKVGINVLFGPSKSLLSSVTTVNGKVDSTSVTTYNYVLSVKGNMKVVTVPSFLIKNEANGDYFSVPEKTILCKHDDGGVKKCNGESRDTLYLVTTVSKDSLVMEDSVLVTTRLYSHGYELSSLAFDERRLPDNSFCRDMMDSCTTMLVDTVDGVPYQTVTVGSYWLYPLKSGQIVIPSNKYIIKYYKNDKSVDPMEAFFNGNKFPIENSCMRNTPILNIQVNDTSIYKGCLYDDRMSVDRNCVVYGLDISTSMSGIVDFDKSRLETAKDIIRKVGNFSNSIIVPFAGCLDSPIILPEMNNRLDTIATPEVDGTALCDMCLSTIMDSKYQCKDIILLTDGVDNSSHMSLKTTVDVIREKGVRVNVVYINSMADSISYKLMGTAVTVKNKITNKKDLEYIAKQTGGVVVYMTSADDMDKVVDSVKKILQKPYMNRKKKESTSMSIKKLEMLLHKYVQ